MMCHLFHADPFTAEWTNLNGSKIAPLIVWHKESNLLFFTGDNSTVDGKNNIAVVGFDYIIFVLSLKVAGNFLGFLPCQVVLLQNDVWTLMQGLYEGLPHGHA